MVVLISCIYPSILKEKDIYIPNIEELKGFNNQIIPIFNTISKNFIENEKLISLRDWLLPMLMNGQATVSD